MNLWKLEKLNLWTKLAGLSGEYQSGGYENVDDSAKVDVFGFDIADVSGSIRLFSDVMKRLDIKLDGDELYEEFQRVYDESVIRNADKHREEPIEKNRVLKGR